MPGTKGLVVELCDDCARELRCCTLLARMYRRRAARLLAASALVIVTAIGCIGCIPPPRVVDAHDVRCVVVRDDDGNAYCVTEKEIQSFLTLVLADRRARQSDTKALAQPGF